MTKVWNLKFSSRNSPDDIFNMIKEGSKTIETRPRNPEDKENDYSNIMIGDTLHITSNDTNNTIDKKVVSIHIYESVDEMINSEDEEKILPGVGSKENLSKVYEEVKNKWGEKYKFELENYGIVAISF